jgi:hypothetical protein
MRVVRLLTAILAAVLTCALGATASAEPISGVVTAVGGGPLSGVTVQAYHTTTGFAASTTTNASGSYTLNVTPGASYYLRTFNSQHYINQLYKSGGNLPCVGNCTIGAGTAVQITGGGGATGIDFSLTLGATITGTIRDEVTGLPLSGVRVEVTDNVAIFAEAVFTNASGVYTTANGFPTGNYFVRTDDNNLGYINEVYPNAPCLLQFNCPNLSGNSVAVVSGAVRSGIDISLRRGGQFSGRVTDAVTGNGLANIEISVLNSAGQQYVRVFTAGDGTFTTRRGVPSGSYYLRTLNTAGYINRFNDGTVCVGTCSVNTITSVTTVEGATTPGVDFNLSIGGRISGVIKDDQTGTPLPSVFVSILTSNGGQVSSTFSVTNGSYVSGDGLPSGTYYVRASSATGNASQGYISELYDDVSCAAGCQTSLGTPIAVTAGATTPGIDLELRKGGRVTGLVTSNFNGAIISNATVSIFNTTGTTVASGVTDATGRYVTVAGIVPGQYIVRVANFSGFINEVYPDIPCIGALCPPGAGTTVNIPAGSTVTMDFGLERGGRFRGTVTDEVTGLPANSVTVQMLDPTGAFIGSASTDPSGNYIQGPGVPLGTYYARTTNSTGYLNELYPNLPCQFGCRVTDGTPIPLTIGNVTPNINFALKQGGRVGGRVTNESTGLGIANITVTVTNAMANTSFSAATDSNGDYIVIGLPDGTYYARTSNTSGFINEAYDDIPCLVSCQVGVGVPLTITAASSVTGVDIALRPGGRVSGVVTDAVTGLPLAGVSISILDLVSGTASTATTDLSGAYLSGSGLASGNYAVFASATGYLSEIYDNVKCLGCGASSGTPVTVTVGATVTGIDFALDVGGRVAGHVTDMNGVPIQSVVIQIFDSAGRSVSTAVTDAGGNYSSSAGLPTGSYFARTINALGYIDEMYNNKPCPSTCPIVGSDPIVVTVGNTTSGIDFALAQGGRVSGTVIDANGGQPLGGVSISIYDSTGRLFANGTTSAFGVYTSGSGLPAGTYFARTSNSLGYINELYGGATCVGTCDVTAGVPIVVGTGITTNINFALAAGARISGRVTDLNGIPISATVVSVTDAAGNVLSTGVTNSVGDYVTTQGLLAGSYYVRASNNAGFVNQLYAPPNGLPCLGACAVTGGTLVPLASGTTTVGIDFRLALGGRIRGRVDNPSAAPIPGVTINIVDGGGTTVAAAVTDGTGAYLITTGLPGGNYFAVTQNTFGLINKVYDNLPCLNSCLPSAGTPIAVVPGSTTSNIDFVLAADADADGDGIAGTIDVNPTVASNDFSDIPLSGTTSGTITARSGWTTLVGDVTPGGVQVQIAGAGAGAATFDVCPVNGLQRVSLDQAGETGVVTCSASGSTTLRAISASPKIELRDPAVGPGVITELSTGQGVTMGSPVTASSTNTQSITARFVYANGTAFGSFDLDAGESVDAKVNEAGAVQATVLVGVVALTVRGQSVTLGAGQSQTFVRAEDVNSDGVISCTDVSIVKASFGKRAGQVGFDARADVNRDALVNIMDLSLVSQALPKGSVCR